MPIDRHVTFRHCQHESGTYSIVVLYDRQAVCRHLRQRAARSTTGKAVGVSGSFILRTREPTRNKEQWTQYVDPDTGLFSWLLVDQNKLRRSEIVGRALVNGRATALLEAITAERITPTRPPAPVTKEFA